MKLAEQDSSKGLPGLKSIRLQLGLTQAQVASMVGVDRLWAGHIERGRRDCTFGLQRNIAAKLCCNPSDLIVPPDDRRLKQIELDFRQSQVDAARQAVSEAS